jgi:hypothetical protein
MMELTADGTTRCDHLDRSRSEALPGQTNHLKESVELWVRLARLGVWQTATRDASNVIDESGLR